MDRAKKSPIDMTTGNPVKKILLFMVPLLVGSLLQQLYSMVDMMIVGNTLGSDAFGAVGLTVPVMYLVIGMAQGFTTGFSVITAQYVGGGKKEYLKKSIAVSILLTAVLAVFFTVISTVFTQPVLRLMNTPDTMMEDAYNYLFVIYLGISTTFFFNCFSSLLRAFGDSRTPLYFLVVSCVINIILDYVLIVYFSMGVAGAAWATVFAQGVSAVLCFVYSVKKFPVMAVTLSDFRCSFKFMWEHLKVGTAMAIQSSLTSISVMILQTAINNLGDAAIKAYSAAGKVSYLSMQPVVNLGFAAATFAAQNYGAGKIDRIKLCVKKGTPVCILMGLLGAAVMIFGGDFFLFIFGVDTSETAVYEYTHQFLYALGGFYVLLGLWHFFRNMLQGMGKTIVPTVSSLVEVVMRIVLSFWLSAAWGFTGVCFVDPFTWVVISVTHIIAYFVIMKKEEKIHI